MGHSRHACVAITKQMQRSTCDLRMKLLATIKSDNYQKKKKKGNSSESIPISKLVPLNLSVDAMSILHFIICLSSLPTGTPL